MESAMCPICRSEIEPGVLCQATLGGDSLFDLVECQSCTSLYLSPLPSLEQLESFYAPHYYGSDWYKQQGLGTAFAKMALKNKSGNFLDVGCGLGYFIDGIRKHSAWKVQGVEFTNSAVDFAKKELGLNVKQGALSDAHFPDDFFDYIRIRNVLEHVTDPMELLRECRRIVKVGGQLDLAVPNGRVDSLDLINFSRSEGKPGLSKSGHLFFFPKQALLWMFKEAGFEIRRSSTYGIRRGLGSLGIWPRFKDWKKYYIAKTSKTVEGDGKIVLPRKKNRPNLYYMYRMFTMNLRMLPGMREFGLDYEILLKPKEPVRGVSPRSEH